MLDANLPVFYLKDPKDGAKSNSTIYLSRPNSEPEPAYSLRHADPTSPAAKNCYAVALFDCWNPEVLFGEVAVRPDWTQSSSAQDATRLNGAVPTPPEPIMPTEFVIQLYNPDQQIIVTRKAGSLMGSTRWDFSMPQRSFCAPSISKLDRTLDNPILAETTPQINFSWKREGKLSKELGCVVTGKSTDVTGKKRHKEPDITIALFKGSKEITIYEPNLYRVEMEDPKGLEVVLLLGAIAIRDVWFGNPKQAFNMPESRYLRDSPGGGIASSKVPSNTSPTMTMTAPSFAFNTTTGAAIGGLYQQPGSSNVQNRRQDVSSPPTDPGTKYEIDRETARLKAQVEKEEREMRAQQEAKRKAEQKAAEEETKRLRKIFEAEQKEQRRKQEEIDRETQRLRKQFGNQPAPPQNPFQAALPPLQNPMQAPMLPPRAGWPAPAVQVSQQRPHSAMGFQQQQQPPVVNYQNPTMSGGLQPPGPINQVKRNRRRSYWDLRS